MYSLLGIAASCMAAHYRILETAAPPPVLAKERIALGLHAAVCEGGLGAVPVSP